MTISNVANGLRSGVCTYPTRPTAPYEGQIIYETDTNRVLVWDNAAWVMIADTDTPPGTQRTGGVVLNGQTTVNIANCFSAEFSSYSVVYNVRTASGNASIQMRLSVGGTPNASAGSYTIAGRYVGYPAVGAADFNDANTQWSFSYYGNFTTNGIITLSKPFVAENTAMCGHSSAVNASAFFGGYHNQATSYDGLYIFNTTSSAMYGNINIYGLRES